jgi:hypothetical protein
MRTASAPALVMRLPRLVEPPIALPLLALLPGPRIRPIPLRRLGHLQYVRRIFSDWVLLVRSDLQLANRPLFQMEQIAFGGLGSVHGYRTYLTVTDDGFLASGELRIPVGRLRLPYLADSGEAGTVQILPFYDFARAWNTAAHSLSAAEFRSRRRSALVHRLRDYGGILLWEGPTARPGGDLDRGSRSLFSDNLGPVLTPPVRQPQRTGMTPAA